MSTATLSSRQLETVSSSPAAGLRPPDLPDEQKEPISTITVRMPKSLHRALMALAKESDSSMNTICVSRLYLSLGAKGGA